jgi:hypothetical protein
MEYYIACKTLLVYFHFACNGHAALSMNTRVDPTPLDADLYNERLFLRELHEERIRHEETLNLWMRAEPGPRRGPTDDWERNQIYTSLDFWYSQLFNPDWKPELIRIEPTESFTEEDLLTSNKSVD